MTGTKLDPMRVVLVLLGSVIVVVGWIGGGGLPALLVGALLVLCAVVAR
jgi:hypothetical protein